MFSVCAIKVILPTFTWGSLSLWTEMSPFLWCYIHLKWNVNLKDSKLLRFIVISSIFFYIFHYILVNFFVLLKKMLQHFLLALFPSYRKSYHSQNSWYTCSMHPLLFLIKKKFEKFHSSITWKILCRISCKSLCKYSTNWQEKKNWSRCKHFTFWNLFKTKLLEKEGLIVQILQ